ncbi:MAG: uracil-DNA glycosylase [Hyphomicrobiaceae bacterium]
MECSAEAPHACSLCPRLADFVSVHRVKEPSWHNGPVRSFGSDDAQFLIVGLAPGLRGANRTGRPFTGDYAGDLLYSTLIEFGLATGKFEARPDDSLRLQRTMITNAVRCVPPENKPTPAEIKTCRRYLTSRIAQLPKLRVMLALGRIAHESALAALGQRQRDFKFAHGARHAITTEDGRSLLLHDSYHCSRYNTNTGRLTTAMFHDVFRAIVLDLAEA